jgi:ABC-type glycerol-3-phosphate transport system substrate-binding protein
MRAYHDTQSLEGNFRRLRMNFRKTIVCVLILAGACLAYAAGGAEAEATTTPAATAKPDRIVVWSYTDNNFKELVSREAEIEKKFGVDIVLEKVAQDAMIARLQASMISGKDWPDIIDGPGSAIHLYATVDPANAVLIPLDNYIKQSKVMPNVIWNRVLKYRIGEYVYGLPNDIHPSVPIYNDEAWKVYGVDLAGVKTWDEFFAAARKLPKDRDGDGKQDVYAISHRNMDVIFRMMVAQSGLQVVDDKGAPRVDTKEMAVVVSKFLEYYNTGMMLAWDFGAFWNYMKEGRLLASVAPDWWVGTAVANLTGSALDGKMRAIPLPTVGPGAPQTAAWGGSFKAITRGASNPDFCYQVLEELQYSKEAVIGRYVTTGIIAPVESWWSDAVFNQPFPVFGGQKIGALETQLAKSLPYEASGLGVSITWMAITENFSSLIGGKTPEQFLKDVQEQATQNYRNASM